MLKSIILERCILDLISVGMFNYLLRQNKFRNALQLYG
jgi:hypothetical protein